MCKLKPQWLKVKASRSEALIEVKHILQQLSLHTVCEEASCPNIMECFNRKSVTFMILGNVCTRNCTFCNVTKGQPQAVNTEEPLNIALAVKKLKLMHVVITSVTRDDLPDGGAGHFAEVISAIKEHSHDISIEVLIPDFRGDGHALHDMMRAKPDIINHNIETVPTLYPTVRPRSHYQRSLVLIRNVKKVDGRIVTKSGLMLGLGESTNDVIQTMKDLRGAKCEILTIGQYLSPSKFHHPVVEYVNPKIFDLHRQVALELGFMYVSSGPLVRSSYHADQMVELCRSR